VHFPPARIGAIESFRNGSGHQQKELFVLFFIQASNGQRLTKIARLSNMLVIDRLETRQALRSRELSEAQADRMGVQKHNRYGLVLECRSCGTTWSNSSDESGELPRDFWVCPARCNL
jgi:hypothetical protein